MGIRHLRNLFPAALVQDAAHLELEAFLRQYGSAPLLLVRIPEGDTELRAGLQSLWLPAATQSTARVAPLRFRTDLLRAHSERAPAKGDRSSRHRDVLLALAEGVHVAAIVRTKGASSGRLGARRVSLGRATNNDVVLRHSSVSKFHASLDPRPEETVMVMDAASTNGTSLNDVRLQRRVPAEAVPGDHLRFGNVEAVLWSAHALWASLH
ncbi:MAG: FHA domain-containing protein [Polyangiaceae bacterium]